MQTRKGQSIEDESMQIIEREIGNHQFDELEWPIVRRVIHTTADFDFAGKNSLVFHENAIKNGMDALEKRCNIIVDVNGVIGGMNKQNPKDFGNDIICNISKPEIMEIAKRENTTRARISMRVAAEKMNGGIVIVGNAPTALTEIIQMFDERIIKPALVIGMPVGFVCAVESKEALVKSDIPFISNIGRKGGSAVSSATINALYILLRNKLSS